MSLQRVHQNFPQSPKPILNLPDSVGLGLESKIWVPNKFPGAADAAGPETTWRTTVSNTRTPLACCSWGWAILINSVNRRGLHGIRTPSRPLWAHSLTMREDIQVTHSWQIVTSVKWEGCEMDRGDRTVTSKWAALLQGDPDRAWAAQQRWGVCIFGAISRTKRIWAWTGMGCLKLSWQWMVEARLGSSILKAAGSPWKART